MMAMKPNLSLVPGGKLSPAEFTALSFEDRMAHLRDLPAKRRLELIVEDPDGRRLTRGFTPQEYYLMVKEIGETDAQQLIVNGSAEQLTVLLDFELWDKWEFSVEKAISWLEHLLDVGEADAMAVLSRLDPELLQLVLLDEIEVGGGCGEFATDSERLGDWDHSFDSIYYLTFRNDKHARLVGTLLDTIFRNDHELYIDLMEGCRASVRGEMEDLCYRFRNGRLADLGFPSYEDAMAIYIPLSPDAFSAGEEKVPVDGFDGAIVATLFPHDENSLLSRVLAGEMTDSLQQELWGVINSVMIAGGGGDSDEDKAYSAYRRVYGWLNLALEQLSGPDEAIASAIVRKEPLKRLFQLAFGTLRELSRAARGITSDVYATGKALRGFAAEIPLFYRGLDPDHADGYREFSSMSDVRMAREFLKLLQ